MGTTTEPVYLRVLEDLRSKIRSGQLEPGARVPSRNAIITNYGVGETAAKHALAVLVAEGLIEPRPGSGCYVRKVPAACYLEHDRPQFPGSPFGVAGSGTADGDGAAAHPPPARKLAWEHQTEQVPAPPQVATRLGLARGATAVRTRYLLIADGEPVQLATSYEPAQLTAGTPVALPEQGPLAGRGVVERMHSIGVDIDQVTEEVAVRQADRAEAGLLAMPAGAVVLVIERVHYTGSTAVETAEVVVPADRFKLRYRFGAAGAVPAGAVPAGIPS
ncbi:MAG TPA: GntR family transcriptional regulator [Streptosporangiaceae bacterium]|nr:GntR family transcriptional regulator [Streptosporangiaceae bacterium]